MRSDKISVHFVGQLVSYFLWFETAQVCKWIPSIGHSYLRYVKPSRLDLAEEIQKIYSTRYN